MGEHQRSEEARRPERLRDFISRMTALFNSSDDWRRHVDGGGQLLGELVSNDDWLASAYAEADPVHYRQYLLFCDGAERFSVTAFVWAPGQFTPIHDHRTWGLIGVLRGAERSEAFLRREGGALEPSGEPHLLLPGQVEMVSPETGDIHRVSNAADQVTISIHIYGGNIGRIERASYAPDGTEKRFVSGYSNLSLPNIWGESSP